MFGKQTRSQGKAMTSAPKDSVEAVQPKLMQKQRIPSNPRLLKKEPSFARKNVMVREKGRDAATGQPEIFSSVQKAEVGHLISHAQQNRERITLQENARAAVEASMPVAMVHARAPYGWFCQEPDPDQEPRRPLTPILSPKNRKSGMKVTEQKQDGQALRKAMIAVDQSAARGRKQMESNVFDMAPLHKAEREIADPRGVTGKVGGEVYHPIVRSKED